MSTIQRLRIAEPNPIFGSNRVFDLFKYSPAVRSGGLLFISGQIGMRPDGGIPDSAAEQADLAFHRLREILRMEGLGFADLVELVSYHVDIENQLTEFRAVKDRYIETDFPAWTILGVSALARPNLLVEIKAIAAIR